MQDAVEEAGAASGKGGTALRLYLARVQLALKGVGEFGDIGVHDAFQEVVAGRAPVEPGFRLIGVFPIRSILHRNVGF